MSDKETNEEKKPLFGFFSGKNKTVYIIMIILIAVIILIYYLAVSDKNKTAENGEIQKAVDEYKSEEMGIEKRMENILSGINGAGEVSVMITYESTSEIVPATVSTKENSKNENDNLGGSVSQREETQVVTTQSSGDESVLVLKEISPKIKGVIVVAEGAGDIKVKLDLQKAVQTLLGISADKVDVFEKEIKF